MPLDKAVIDRIDKLSHSMPSEAAAVVENELRRIADKMQLLVERADAEKGLACIPLFNDRPVRAERAIDFFHRNYDRVIGQYSIFADDLLRHDPRLYAALAVHLTDRGERLSSLLPVRPRSITSGQRRDSGARILNLKAS